MTIVNKVVKARGEYAKKGTDIMPGDEVTIADEGEWTDGQYGKQFVIKIHTRNGDKNVNLNQTSINILHDEFGKDSAGWVGKHVIIRAKKDVVAGKKVEIYYFVTPEWDFDDFRELVKAGETGTIEVNTNDEPEGEIPF